MLGCRGPEERYSDWRMKSLRRSSGSPGSVSVAFLAGETRSAFNLKEAKAELKHGSGFHSCALVT